MPLQNSINDNDEISIEINDKPMDMVNMSELSSESIPNTDRNNQELSGGNKKRKLTSKVWDHFERVVTG